MKTILTSLESDAVRVMFTLILDSNLYPPIIGDLEAVKIILTSLESGSVSGSASYDMIHARDANDWQAIHEVLTLWQAILNLLHSSNTNCFYYFH